MDTKVFDLVVIGGGVNGAGIARDAAGRGLDVLLCEKDDLASATSSASSKLIHGGLRYLEHHEFKLVHEGLKEREVLLRNAPHIIWPMEFILPHDSRQRPAWLIRLGLFLYDLLGGRKTLKGSRGVNLATHKAGVPLMDEYRKGFSYADCWVDDARLVVLNAISAAEKGAKVLTRTACVGLRVEGGLWHATLKTQRKSEKFEIRARAVVNAAGPWVSETLGLIKGIIPNHKTRLVKGSHIIVPRQYTGDQAYILQNTDDRVVFAIPYEQDYTLIGTTDVEVDDPSDPKASEEEIDYLCAAVNRYFKKEISPEDVIGDYSGIRPLLDDEGEEAHTVTRDYVLDLDQSAGAPILNIFGGKITTYRSLSEDAVNEVMMVLDKPGKPWTKSEPLPGGNLGTVDYATFFDIFRKEYHWLPDVLAVRYARSYGARARKMLKGCYRMSDMGEDFGDRLYEVEVRYLVDHEWARTPEDVLWRRTKLGLHVSDETKRALDAFLKRYHRHKKAA